MNRTAVVLAAVLAAIALVAGLAVGEFGPLAVVGLVGLAIAAAAFIDLRVTLLAIVPAMVLLPELPLAIPVRTEDLLIAPLTVAWLALLAMGRADWPSTRLNVPLFTVIAVELAAVLWGAFRGTAGLSPELYSASFFFLKTVEVTFLFFITISAVRSESDVRTLAYVLCGSGALLGLWGVFERATTGTTQAITGPAGPLGYSLLGLTFVVLLAAIGSLVVTHRSGTARTLLAVAAAPIVYSLMFTFSRQSYVGAATAVAVLAWVRDRRLIIPVLAIAVALPFAAPEVVQERAASIVAGVTDPQGGQVFGTRIRALRERLPEVLTGSPIFGFGPASLPPGFLDNQYLLTVYYSGLLGLGAFLWLLWRAFTTARDAYARLHGDLKGLGLAWLASTVGLAVAGLAGSPFVAVRVRQVYWFLGALAVAAVGLARTARPAADDDRVIEDAEIGSVSEPNGRTSAGEPERGA